MPESIHSTKLPVPASCEGAQGWRLGTYRYRRCGTLEQCPTVPGTRKAAYICTGTPQQLLASTIVDAYRLPGTRERKYKSLSGSAAQLYLGTGTRGTGTGTGTRGTGTIVLVPGRFLPSDIISELRRSYSPNTFNTSQTRTQNAATSRYRLQAPFLCFHHGSGRCVSALPATTTKL